MLQLNVSGMTCGHCVSAVTRAAGEVAGARDVKVDLEHGLVTVGGDPDPAAVRAAIEAEGYQVQAA